MFILMSMACICCMYELIVILCMSLSLFFAWICVLEDMLCVMHVCDSCNVIMCSIACMNYCQFHRSLYVSSNYVLFVLNSL
jgi:hypothetical protein